MCVCGCGNTNSIPQPQTTVFRIQRNVNTQKSVTFDITITNVRTGPARVRNYQQCKSNLYFRVNIGVRLQVRQGVAKSMMILQLIAASFK